MKQLFDWLARVQSAVAILRHALQKLSADPRFQSAAGFRAAAQLSARLHFASSVSPFPCFTEYGYEPCPLCEVFGPSVPNPTPHTRLNLRDFRKPAEGCSELIVPTNGPIARLAQLVGEDKLCFEGTGVIGIRGTLQEAYTEMLRHTRHEQNPYRN